MKLLNKQDLDKLVEEPFEKFLSRLDLKCPDPIEAIPVEWIKRYIDSTLDEGNSQMPGFKAAIIKEMVEDWEKENGTDK